MGESNTVDPWLIDDVSQPKKFTFAGKNNSSSLSSKVYLCNLFCLPGFFPSERESQLEMEKLEEELVEKIESLGGEFVPTDQWDNSITHVIAKLEPEKEGLPEKVMGAIAGGKWVLTKVIIVLFYLDHLTCLS